jgi:hypothetical protein
LPPLFFDIGNDHKMMIAAADVPNGDNHKTMVVAAVIPPRF